MYMLDMVVTIIVGDICQTLPPEESIPDDITCAKTFAVAQLIGMDDNVMMLG